MIVAAIFLIHHLTLWQRADEFVEIECLKECVVIFAEAILRICGE